MGVLETLVSTVGLNKDLVSLCSESVCHSALYRPVRFTHPGAHAFRAPLVLVLVLVWSSDGTSASFQHLLVPSTVALFFPPVFRHTPPTPDAYWLAFPPTYALELAKISHHVSCSPMVDESTAGGAGLLENGWER